MIYLVYFLEVCYAYSDITINTILLIIEKVKMYICSIPIQRGKIKSLYNFSLNGRINPNFKLRAVNEGVFKMPSRHQHSSHQTSSRYQDVDTDHYIVLLRVTTSDSQ